MRLYSEELIREWAELAPRDEIFVIGNQWAADAFDMLDNVKVHVVRESGAGRILGQWIYSGLLARRLKVHAVLSTSPIVTPLIARSRRICVVADWRHVKRPEEFGVAQKLYRKLWVWSTNRAACAIQISTKTDAETAVIASRSTRKVIEPGQDQARRWVAVDRTASGRLRFITFGHHSNKRPDLAIEAFSEIADSPSGSAELVVLGARGDYADQLRVLADSNGVADRVIFPGFVDAIEYESLIQSSDVVVLVSSDEGFGLPVSEARYFGIPVVTTSDSGLQEIHGDGLHVGEPTRLSLATQMQFALDEGVADAGKTVGDTWEKSASRVREIVRACVVDKGSRRRRWAKRGKWHS
jgi:glycosyltransferase involved in cell wall biosynthesis